MATNFGITSATPYTNVIQSINYLLATQGTANGNSNSSSNSSGFTGNVLTANLVTGVISTVSNTGATVVSAVSYLYPYIDVKYGNSATGAGFTSNCVNTNYYGVHNTQTPVEDSNPADYSWTQVAGGFGTNKILYFTTGGGNTINFYPGNAAPYSYYSPVVDNQPILLSLVSNTLVSTGAIQQTAATQVVFNQNNTSYQLLNFVNGNTTIGGAGYIWPNYTRGFAIGGGTTISPATTGALGGSNLQINYNTFLNTAGNATVQSYNLIELWKSGSSSYYKDVFQTVRTGIDYGNAYASSGNVDIFSIAGTAGSYFAGNLGNIFSEITGTSNNLYDSYLLLPSDTSFNEAYIYGANGTICHFLAPTGFQANTTVQLFGASANPVFNIYGVTALDILSGSSIFTPTLLVGSGGYIAFCNGQSTFYGGANQYVVQSSGVFADLLDITGDIPPKIFVNGATVNYVVVGSGGTILYNQITFGGFYGNITAQTGWFQASSGTINNLNAVACNYSQTGVIDASYGPGRYTRGNTYVAVGNSGTILYSGSGSGPWTRANSVPTTQNLYGVGYTNGTWVAVGAQGTIISSTDGSNWTGPYANPADGVTVPANGARDLYGVAGGLYSSYWVASGQEIILSSNTASPTGGWNSSTYLGGTSLNSTLTRLQYQGSWANVANVSQPPAQQQITNGQVISGSYTDYNYIAGTPVTYYLVAGNMYGNANVYVNGPNLTITEIKR